MIIQCICPKWSMGMPWVEGIKKVFTRDGVEVDFRPEPDYALQPAAVLYLWCDEVARRNINASPEGSNNYVVFRRYEFFTGEWGQIVWSKVRHLIFVNDVFRIEFESAFPEKPVPTSVIYNAVDPDIWTYSEHKHGKNIAMVGYINQKKNFPLALQILAALPEDYTLHIIGGVQCPETYMYLCQMAHKLKRNLIVHEAQSRQVLNRTLDQMDYLLCTAISEGNPNNVNEAMMKGIKPLVHCWPGADWQYPKDCVFSTVYEAINRIIPNDDVESGYDSKFYRSWAEDKFSLKNLEALRALVLAPHAV